jgi:hypothetical protein
MYINSMELKTLPGSVSPKFPLHFTQVTDTRPRHGSAILSYAWISVLGLLSGGAS